MMFAETSAPLLHEADRPPRPSVADPEFPVYAALKLHLHDRLRKGHPGLPPICARNVQALLERASREATGMAELHGVTSHFLRERLRNLNHGTVLLEVGPGLRDALMYLWKEPTNRGTIQSHAELQALMGEHVFLALDLSRMAQMFGTSPVKVETYFDYFQWLRRRIVGRPWSKLTKHNAAGPEFVHFLAQRVRLLVKKGWLIERNGWMRLSPAGQAAAYWFDLFMHSVDYGPTASKSSAPSTSHSVTA